MKALDEILSDRIYERERSYTEKLGIIVQPCSYADFQSHPDFTVAFQLWTQNDTFRGLDFARIWSFVLNIKYVLSANPGSLAEVGVYQGQSSAVLSYYAEKFGRKCYLADTFQGFPDEQLSLEEDKSEGKRVAFKDSSLEAARNVVGDYSGNRWIVGSFPDSVTQEMREDEYAFVSIDCDIYQPIAEGLKFFWPRLVSGGMIFVHDYSSGHWPGAERAVNEFCAENGVAGCLLPDYAGSYVLVRQAQDPSIATKDLKTPAVPSANASAGNSAAELARLRESLLAIQSSRSWRLTSPLRAMKRFFSARSRHVKGQ